MHVWDWWWHLNSRRPPGYESLAPISYSEIKAWVWATHKLVAPEEIAWLVAMDNAWLTAIAEERKAKHERDKEDAQKNRGKSK